jgi:hypothetical protein
MFLIFNSLHFTKLQVKIGIKKGSLIIFVKWSILFNPKGLAPLFSVASKAPLD